MFLRIVHKNAAKSLKYSLFSYWKSSTEQIIAENRSMKVSGAEEEHLLTNSEVLDLLASKKADNSIQKSEEEVFSSLNSIPGICKDREKLIELVKEFKQYDLTKEEVFQLVNHMPPTVLEAFLCIEQAILDSRIVEADLEKIVGIVCSFKQS